MPSLDGQLFYSWICTFIFVITLLVYGQGAQNSPLLGKTEITNRTLATTSVPFGARLFTSHQIGRSKHFQDSKNISSVPNLRNPNGLLVLNKKHKMRGVSSVRNSSVGSTNMRSNRIIKKIKSRRRLIQPTSRNNHTELQISNRKIIPITEKNNSTFQFKLGRGVSPQGNVLQNEPGNRRLNKINNFDVSSNSRNRGEDIIQENQRSRVFDMHRNSKTDSIVKINMFAQNNTIVKNKNGLQEIRGNRLEPLAMNRMNNQSHTVIINLNTTQKHENRVRLPANGRNGNIVTNVNVSWTIDLARSSKNRTVSLSRNTYAIPIEIQSINTSLLQHRYPTEQHARNRMTGLSESRSRNKNLTEEFVHGTRSYSRNPLPFGSPTKPSSGSRIYVLSDAISSNNNIKKGLVYSPKSHSGTRATVPTIFKSLNKSILSEKLGNYTEHSADRHRMLLLSGNRSRYNSPTYTFGLSTESYAKPRVTTTTNILPFKKNIKTDKNGNLNGGQQIRSRMTVTSNNIPSSFTLPTFIHKIESGKPENYVRLDQAHKVSNVPETLIINKDISKGKYSTWSYKKNSSIGYTTTLLQDFMKKRQNSTAEIRPRNTAMSLIGTNNTNEKSTKVMKDYSPFHFPHSRKKVKDEPNFNAESSKQKLPCPCYWSKEKCGCDCAGSLNYDDFQTLASYFQPCLNFSFTLNGGHYFSLPPNFFTRASPIQNIDIKISNSTFDYLFDPTPDTSPFRKLVVEQKGHFEIFNVKVRQGWNWASLKNLRVSSAEKVFHNGTVKLVNDLSSSGSTAYQIENTENLKDLETPGLITLQNDTTKLLKTSKSMLFQNRSTKNLEDLKSSESVVLQSSPTKMLKSHRTLDHGTSAIKVVLVGCGELKRLSSDFAEVANGGVGELTISDGGMEMVGSGAFASFDGLVRFRLPRNKLRSIKRTDLPSHPTELVEMDLSDNQLQTLDDDFFVDMPALSDVSLKGNPLHTLGQETFGTVLGKTHLQGLDAFPLHCDCRLRWLKSSSFALSPVFVENLRGATCRRPAHLRATPFRDLAIEHLRC